MYAAVKVVRAILLVALVTAAVAGWPLISDADAFDVNSSRFRVMLWAMAVASLTSPIMVSYIIPWRGSGGESDPDDEGEASG